ASRPRWHRANSAHRHDSGRQQLLLQLFAHNQQSLRHGRRREVAREMLHMHEAPRIRTVGSHVIEPTATPSNVARAPKLSSTSMPFPVMLEGFGGIEMNQRTPAPSAVRTPVPLFRTLSPPRKIAPPPSRKSRPTTLFSIVNVPDPNGLT